MLSIGNSDSLAASFVNKLNSIIQEVTPGWTSNILEYLQDSMIAKIGVIQPGYYTIYNPTDTISAGIKGGNPNLPPENGNGNGNGKKSLLPLLAAGLAFKFLL